MFSFQRLQARALRSHLLFRLRAMAADHAGASLRSPTLTLLLLCYQSRTLTADCTLRVHEKQQPSIGPSPGRGRPATCTAHFTVARAANQRGPVCQGSCKSPAASRHVRYKARCLAGQGRASTLQPNLCSLAPGAFLLSIFVHTLSINPISPQPLGCCTPNSARCAV